MTATFLNILFTNSIRSGNVNELQPKAVGSSLLVQLTCSLVKNMLHSIGMNFVTDVIVFPSATGMAITISLLTLKKEKEVIIFIQLQIEIKIYNMAKN